MLEEQVMQSFGGEEEMEGYPKPTSYLLGSEELKNLALSVDLPLAPFLTREAYKEACSNPVQCNLLLRTAMSDPMKQQNQPAALPAADGCCLSSVIRARLQRWPSPTAEGRIELELQIAVGQEILDRVVTAVYKRQLLVCSSTAESLLLVADYLQMDWLTDAVQKFATERLLSRPSLEVCKLAAAHPGLGIFEGAVRTLMASQPGAEALVDLMLMSGTSDRAAILTAAAQLLTPGARLDYLLSLSRHPEVSLTREEAKLLVELQPSLEHLPNQNWFQASDISATALLPAWSKLYMTHSDLAVAGKERGHEPSFLVWNIPLHEAKRALDLKSPQVLTSRDGRSHQLMTCKVQEKVGLYISAVDGALKGGDRFKLFAVGSVGLCRIVEVQQQAGSTLGYPDWVSELEGASQNTIADGKYLPVALQML